MQELIHIDGKLMPPPREYAVSLQDIDGSNAGRTETGVMFRNRVRANVYKIQISWRLRRSDIVKVIAAVSPEAFSVKFFDPNTLTFPTRKMYAGDRSAVMLLNNDKEDDTWWDLSVNFVEY